MKQELTKQQQNQTKTRRCLTKGVWLLFILLSCNLVAFSQENTRVYGRILEAKDPPEPLPGVSIKVKGSTKGTSTDEKGVFELNVPKNSVLVISMIGYKPKEYIVRSEQNNLLISLEKQLVDLDQVVVTGFTKQKTREIASSVSSINMENLVNKPVTQLSQALQGGSTGISVNQTSGVVGSEQTNIRIRGVSTIGNAAPLVLVDGVPFDMNNLDPNSVASITVLKDAASASMYGSRGANGVIVITTKRGVAGTISMDYNGYYGIQQLTAKPDFVGAVDYMKAVNQRNVNIGQAPAFTQIAIDSTAAGVNPVKYPNTDWWDLVTRKAIPIQQHSLIFSGGSTTSRFVINVNHLDQKGQFKALGGSTPTSYGRTTVRINSTVDLTKNIMVYSDLFASRSIQTEPHLAGDGRNTGYLQDKVFAAPPTIVSIYPQPTGSIPSYIRPGTVFYGTFGESWNPVALVERGGTIRRTRDEAILNVRPQWNISNELTFNGQASYTVASGLDLADQDAYTFFDNNTFTQVGSYALIKTGTLTGRNSYFYWGGNLDYKSTLGKNKEHSINAMLGYTQEVQNPGQENRTAFFDFVALRSVFLKATYSYKQRYLLEVGMRRDGSSLFGPGNKWGNFPSVAVGWNIDQENFLKEVNEIQSWKLRASYGLLGNNRVRPYLYQTVLNSNGTVASNGNTDLKWEKLTEFNVGTDIALKSGLDLTVDWYNKKSSDLLLTADPLFSSAIGVNSAGGANSPTFNAGSARIKGLDAHLKYNQTLGKDFTLNFGIGYSKLKSTVLKVVTKDVPIISGNTIIKVGGALREYYGYKSQGLLQQADIDNPNIPKLSGATSAGDIKYVDINGDGKIDANDRTALGSTQPTDILFSNLGFNYKGFDFDMLVNYQGGSPIFYQGAFANPFSTNPQVKPMKEQMDTWTPQNTTAALPRFTTAGVVFSDFWKVNGGFLRVRYIQVGYSLPKELATKLRMKTARLYVNAQNPFTFTKVDMMDPETSLNSVSTGTVSVLKVYTVGLNFKF